MLSFTANEMILKIAIIFILTLINGFFSMSEIALITVRKTAIANLAKAGEKRAKIVQKLHENPESLFATIQVGISIITIASSAFAGLSLAEDLAILLRQTNISLIVDNSFGLSFVAVVAFVSYVSITIGELIPKSLGLRYAEPLALFAAYPIWGLSKISSGLIKLLNASSNLFLKLFKDSTSFTEGRLSEEEIRSLISEGRRAGTIEAHEDRIIQNVFDFSDLNVDKIMIPRTQMAAFDINLPAKKVIHEAIESGYSRIPIYESDLNNIVGILYTKQLLAKFDEGNQNLDLKQFLVPAYFVPTTMHISEVLQRLQRKKAHMAMVTDEHGEITGLVTMEDVLEEIVGEIADETDEAKRNIKQSGTGFLVAGDILVVDFNKYFKTELPENKDFTTVSGFILENLGRFSKANDIVNWNGIKFTVKEVTLRTVKTVFVEGVKR